MEWSCSVDGCGTAADGARTREGDEEECGGRQAAFLQRISREDVEHLQ